MGSQQEKKVTGLVGVPLQLAGPDDHRPGGSTAEPVAAPAGTPKEVKA